MSLFDCEKCWSTPCECGWDYKNWEIKRIEELIKTLQKVILKKKKEQSNG